MNTKPDCRNCTFQDYIDSEKGVWCLLHLAYPEQPCADFAVNQEMPSDDVEVYG
jgi:hypothetical protein